MPSCTYSSIDLDVHYQSPYPVKCCWKNFSLTLSPTSATPCQPTMKEDIAVHKARIKSFQMTVLVSMVFVMVIGGCVFGLGVKTRPVLRITRAETFHHVKWILDMMIATGLAQLGTAGLNCFATCCKQIWVLYLGVALTSLNVCLELGSIGTSLHLLHSSDELANEDVVHPWYWVECQVTESCHSALLSYVYYFVMPQVALSALAIFLQCLVVLTMGRMVRTVAEHRKTVEAYKEWYREHGDDNEGDADEPPPPPVVASGSKSGSKQKKAGVSSGIEMTPMKQIDELEEPDFTILGKVTPNEGSLSSVQTPPSEPAPEPESTFDHNYHTPSSILKVDHGYVQASGGSLDYLDSPRKKGGLRKPDTPTPPKGLAGAQSITFQENVQVHYYDQNAEILDSEDPDKL